MKSKKKKKIYRSDLPFQIGFIIFCVLVFLFCCLFLKWYYAPIIIILIIFGAGLYVYLKFRGW